MSKCRGKVSIKIVLTGKNQGITTLISFRIDQAFKVSSTLTMLLEIVIHRNPWIAVFFGCENNHHLFIVLQKQNDRPYKGPSLS